MGINSDAPGFGTAVKAASDKWDAGDKAGAIADGAALVTQQALMQKTPEMAGAAISAAPKLASAAGTGLKVAALDLLAGGAGVSISESFTKNARLQVAPTAVRAFPASQLPTFAKCRCKTP